MERLMFYGTLTAAIGSGLIGGAFFVFSVAVMPALRRLPAREGMAAMQSINVVIVNPVFLGVFIGTALLSAALAVLSILNWSDRGAGQLLAASLLYAGGSFLVTAAFNVPLNNSMAAADPETEAGEKLWENYLRIWTYWNHVRTVASIAATLLFILSMIR